MKHSHDTGDEQRNDIETVFLNFRTYCEPRKNNVFERYQFVDRNQNASEPIDQWVTGLRSKAAKCEFGTLESDMIRDKVVFGVRDRIKERLLREADLTLNKALAICRAAEISKQHIEAMMVTQTQALPVHTIQAQKKGGRHKKETSMPTQSSDGKSEYTNTPVCKYCGRSHTPASVFSVLQVL